MIEPYVFVRAVTFALGAWWTVLGLRRILRAGREWKERMRPLAIDDRWWRRQITLMTLRATVLDPLNVALACLLLYLWSLPL